MPLCPKINDHVRPSPRRASRAAFSLVELSVVLVIISIVAVMGLEGVAFYMNRTAYKVTRERLEAIDQAMVRYARTYRRLPCPASESDTITSSCYGKEKNGASAVTCAVNTGACNASVVPSGGAFWGHVPVRDLGLPLNTMVDGYGSRILYVVTQNQVYNTTYHATNNFDQTADAIIVRSGKVDQNCGAVGQLCQNRGNASYFLLSPGADRRGGYSPKAASAAQRCYTSPNSSVDGMIDTVNCRMTEAGALTLQKTGAVNISPNLSTLILYDSRFNAGTEEYSHFDDLVKWRPKSGI